MDQAEPETPVAKRLPPSEMDTPVSVLRSAWPGWIRTHIPDEDDRRRRDRVAARLPTPRPTEPNNEPPP